MQIAEPGKALLNNRREGTSRQDENTTDLLRKIECSVDQIARSMEEDRLKFVVLECTDLVFEFVRTEKTKFRERTKRIAEFHRSIVVFTQTSNSRIDRLEDSRNAQFILTLLILLFHTRDVPRRSRGRMCKHTSQHRRFARNTDLKAVVLRSLGEKIGETHFSTSWNRVVEFGVVSRRSDFVE